MVLNHEVSEFESYKEGIFFSPAHPPMISQPASYVLVFFFLSILIAYRYTSSLGIPVRDYVISTVMAATARAPLHFIKSDVDRDRDTIPVRRKLPTSGAACRFLIDVPHLKDSEKGRGKELQLAALALTTSYPRRKKAAQLRSLHLVLFSSESL